ncbi:acid transporter [Anaeramoeba flamelloides]|uniref:Acid transporter n=1 Tax=Anaeramoeba flamelloides TaxID=1746091 RepID=A0AAV7YEK4_9EUKA|nr:acid transporter [Anaeramoeba flamelloides]
MRKVKTLLDSFRNRNRNRNNNGDRKKTFSPWTAYAFSINYTLGVGILNLPLAFYRGGFIMSIIFLLLCSLICSITMVYLIETEARAEELVSLAEYQRGIKNTFSKQLTIETFQSDLSLSEFEDEHLIVGNESSPLSQRINSHYDFEEGSEEKLIGDEEEKKSNNKKYKPTFEIKDRKFEYNELLLLFFGKYGKLFGSIAISFYLYGILWSYGVVAATTLTTVFPIKSLTKGDICEIDGEYTSNCQNNYIVYLIIFAIFVLPVSCLDLTEQKILQIGLTIFRFLSLILMISTCVDAIFTSKDTQSQSDKPPYLAEYSLFNISNIGYVLGASVFSQVIHHSATVIIEPIKDKKKASKIYFSSFFTTFSTYTLIGIICSLYFGEKTKSVVSLNWINYTGGDKHAQVWAKMIKYIIMLFPTIDIFSAFPLNVVTLGTSLFNYFYPELNRGNLKNKKLKKILFRLFAAIPPLIAALLVKQIPIIVIFNGIFGCLIGYLIPALLNYKSKKMCKIIFNKDKTPYSNISSNRKNIILVFTLGCLILISTLVSSIIDEVKKYKK